jgi:murein L,D-transpeptidase YafK
MDWTKFEQELNDAFAAYVKTEKRVVHSDQMKLSILQDKIKCDALLSVNSALQVAMSSNPNYTYDEAMADYRAAAMNIKTKNAKHVP